MVLAKLYTSDSDVSPTLGDCALYPAGAYLTRSLSLPMFQSHIHKGLVVMGEGAVKPSHCPCEASTEPLQSANSSQSVHDVYIEPWLQLRGETITGASCSFFVNSLVNPAVTCRLMNDSRWIRNPFGSAEAPYCII